MLKKLNFTFLFLSLCYFCCWLSISTSTIDITNLYNIVRINNVLGNASQKIIPDSNELINFFRQLAIYLMFPILLFLNIANFKKINFRKNTVFLIFLLYFLFQIPGLIFTENSLLNIGYVISALNIFLILIFSDLALDQKKTKIFLYISLFFLIVITFLNRGTFINFLFSQEGQVMYTYFDLQNENFLGKSNPRSTGSARILLLIYIISTTLFSNFFDNKKFIKGIFYLLISICILLFQSRTVIVLLLIFLFFNFILNYKINFKIFFRYIITHVFNQSNCI